MLDRTLPSGICLRAAHLRGVASIEAVIALPVLILLWVGIVYTYERIDAQQQTSLQSRSCVWQHADDGCQDVPANCSGSSQDDVGAEDAAAENIKQSTLAKTQASSHRNALDRIFGVFGKQASASAAKPIDRPEMLGGGQQTFEAAAAATCNERKRDPKDILLSLVNEVMPW